MSSCVSRSSLMILNWPIVANQRRAVSVRRQGFVEGRGDRCGDAALLKLVGSRHSESTSLQCRQIGSTELTTAMGSSSTVESGTALSEE